MPSSSSRSSSSSGQLNKYYSAFHLSVHCFLKLSPAKTVDKKATRFNFILLKLSNTSRLTAVFKKICAVVYIQVCRNKVETPSAKLYVQFKSTGLYMVASLSITRQVTRTVRVVQGGCKTKKVVGDLNRLPKKETKTCFSML